MKDKLIQWTVNAVWLIALISLALLLINKSQKWDHAKHTHARTIELIEKGISLGLSEQIEAAIHAYRIEKSTNPEAIYQLNGKLTIQIEQALDQKYSETNTVTVDQVYDRNY